MRKKLYYCDSYHKRLETLLQKNQVSYNIVKDVKEKPLLISFSLYEESPVCQFIQLYTRAKPIVTNEFTNQELMEAEYLTVIPVVQCVEIMNTQEAFLYACKRRAFLGREKYEHREQIEKLEVKSRSLPRQTFLFSEATGSTEIFGKRTFRDIVQRENISGIQFLPVLDTKSKEERNGLFQIRANQTVEASKIIVDKDIKVKKCPVCGKLRYICGQDHLLTINCYSTDLGSDFYQTEAIFGEGFGYRYYIISNQLYRLLLKYGLNKNLRFEPVELLNTTNNGVVRKSMSG